MTENNARVKVEAGKFREACQSFVDYYKEKTKEIGVLTKEVMDLKKEYNELYKIFYRPSRWASYDVIDYYRIGTPYDIFMKVVDYIKMFDHSADGLVEMSVQDIKFLHAIDNSVIDQCISKLDKNKTSLIGDIERLKNNIKERDAEEAKETQDSINKIIELKESLKEQHKDTGLKLVSKPEKEDVNINYIYLAALFFALLVSMLIFT